VAVAAARTLARRYNARGGYLQAWGPLDHPLARRSSAIDTMMNLPLLWWAARAAGDGRLAEIARAHAETSRRCYLRPDGATYHTYAFDPDTGQPLGGGTFQGFAADSAWSRGLSWGIYGWALAYREHAEAGFLAAAERAARYYLEHLPPDGVPPYDFGDPDPARPVDSSASAVVAGAFLELAERHPDAARRRYYRKAALQLLAALERFTARGREATEEGVLLHGCYSRPHNDAVDSSVKWGDWFYLRHLAHLTAGPTEVP
jgi:unsaturated chondroitin disaccharide hydrolase